jgi:hypothetical protein
MSLLLDRAITKAVSDCPLPTDENEDTAAFSDAFEHKMSRLIRTQRRRRYAGPVLRGTAVLATLSLMVVFGVHLVGIQEIGPIISGFSGGEESIMLIPVETETEYVPEEDDSCKPESLNNQRAGLCLKYLETYLVLLPESNTSHESGGKVYTRDELRNVSEFDFKEPAYLPEGMKMLGMQYSLHNGYDEYDENGVYSYADAYPCVGMQFSMPMRDPSAGNWHLHIRQFYLGSDGYVIYAGPYNDPVNYLRKDFETVMVNDIEASYYLVYVDNTIGEEWAFSVLHWVQDGIFFRIAFPYRPEGVFEDITIEDVIAIAESMR